VSWAQGWRHGRVLCAQHQAMPVIGYLSSRSPGDSAALVAAFRKGLGEAGFIEGQNVAIEYRWAEGHIHDPDRIHRRRRSGEDRTC
jgi:hypothetical protein